ncbi:MAG: hypothetical protein ACO1QR_06685, partial [Chthoniobacteraceae bacterium]
MSFPTTRIAFAAGTFLALTACDRDEVQVYVAPKDQPPPVAPATPSPQTASAPAPSRPAPPPKAWDVPPGWQSTDPGQVSAANFVLKNEQGEASINVTPLPNMAGKEELVVNLWRQQVGQEPLAGEAVAAALTSVPVGKAEGKSFEISGSREGKPSLIVTAMLHEENVSWFFKLSGDQAVVEAQKPVFFEFLKSVRPAEGGAAPAAASAAPAAAEAAPQFKWDIPQGWEQLAPGAMQVAKFKVPEKDGAKAELAVSVFPSDTGGTLANVNRWRGQLGMTPVDEAGLAEVAKPLDPAIPNATLVDLSQDGRQMLGAIVPRENRWWFYKLMGDAPAVA